MKTPNKSGAIHSPPPVSRGANKIFLHTTDDTEQEESDPDNLEVFDDDDDEDD